MKTYNQLITELFDKPYPFKMTSSSNDEVYYEFNTPTQKFTVAMAYNGLEKTWEMVFTDEEGLLGLTGKGSKETSSILATVMAAIKDFIKKKKPEKMYFSADKGEGKSRSRLYTTLVKTQTPSGYDYSIDEKPTTTYFTLEKK
jgi:hypothetical protein